VKSKQSTLSILRQLIEGHNGYALLLFIVMLLAAGAEAFGLSLFLPLLSGLIDQEAKFGKIFEYLDFILGSIPSEYKMIALLTILVVVFLLKNALLVTHKGMSVHFGMRLREQWSQKILSSYLKAKYQDVMNEKQGIMFHNVVIEPFRVSKSITDLLGLLSKFIMALAIFVLLIMVNWKVSLVSALFGGLIYLLIKNMTFEYSMRFGKKRLDIQQNISAVSSESVGAIKEIKMLGAAQKYLSDLMEKLREFTRVQTKFSVFSILPDNILEIALIVLISVAIVYIQMASRIDMKEALPILGFFIVAGQKLFKHISFIISQRMKVASALPSLKMIHSLIFKIESKEIVYKGDVFEKLESDVVVKSIIFSYGNRSEPVLFNFNMRIMKNKMTAIVGTSGSGKSTIADLLMRLLTPQSGRIECNGKDIQEFSLESWRGKIGYVSQDPYLFNMTLRENILLGKPDAREEEIVSAARRANIHDFITSLPEGYDTIVGDRGVKLSGGQRQRVVIARAIISDPEIFIFDEATSALDREAEEVIQQSIENLASKKTILVIAHRLSTIEKADMVYDMDRIAKINDTGDFNKDKHDIQDIIGIRG
jgi:ABC-type multidrug transport system fused ATPase/permease subunit